MIIVLQEDKLSKSCWSCCQSSGDFICLKHLVSSAKRRALLQWMESGRSFMYIINSRGPRMLPWGTPDTAGSKYEYVSLIDTNWDLLVRYSLNQVKKFPEILNPDSLWSKFTIYLLLDDNISGAKKNTTSYSPISIFFKYFNWCSLPPNM